MLPVETSVLSIKSRNKGFPFVAPMDFSSHGHIAKNLVLQKIPNYKLFSKLSIQPKVNKLFEI